MTNKRSPEELSSFAQGIDSVLRTHPGIVQTEPDIVHAAVQARDLAWAKYKQVLEHPTADESPASGYVH